MKVFVLALAVCFLGLASGDTVVPYTKYRNASEIGFDLESPQITDFGTWGEPEYCPHGQFVTGFQLKIEPKSSVDNTALNGVRFYCGRAGGEKEQYNITSKIGYFGNWGTVYDCATYMVGFELQSQEYQGPRSDDVAATNMKMFCFDGSSKTGYNDNGHIYKETRYTGPRMCSTGKAICAIQTQVERYQFFGDDTSLNNIRVKCCDVTVSAGDIAGAIPDVPVIGVTDAPAEPEAKPEEPETKYTRH